MDEHCDYRETKLSQSNKQAELKEVTQLFGVEISLLTCVHPKLGQKHQEMMFPSEKCFE